MALSRRKLIIAGAGLISAPVLFYAADPFGAAGHDGPPSDHFDGRRFRNQGNVREHGFRDLLRWRRTSNPGPWPEWVAAKPGPRPEPRVPDLRITHVNHSTVLIQMDGMNVLTDPVWSERASPVSWAGPRRHCAPGIRFEDLPPLDLVLVSHNHYDHLDIATLRALGRAHSPRFVAPLGVGAYLKRHGLTAVSELDWWQHGERRGELAVTAVPAQHFSGRGVRDRNRTLWCGYVLESKAGRVYFAGDTASGPQFEQIRERFGSPRLALLPVGAFEPRWFMSPVHLSPEEAVEAHRILGAATSVGIHYATFRIADDGYEEPRRIAEAAADSAGARFHMLPFGAPFDVPRG